MILRVRSDFGSITIANIRPLGLNMQLLPAFFFCPCKSSGTVAIFPSGRHILNLPPAIRRLPIRSAKNALPQAEHGDNTGLGENRNSSTAVRSLPLLLRQ
jgi:hypothetical protein